MKQRKEVDKKYREQAINLKDCETNAIKDCPKKFPKKHPEFTYTHNVCLRDRAVSNSYYLCLYYMPQKLISIDMWQNVTIVSNRFWKTNGG